MSIIATLEKKLNETFNPSSLEIVNESHLHSGHQPGFDGEGETHIRIKIISEDFESMNRVARHRQINALFVDEMDEGLHAIAIEAHTPAEKENK